MELSRKHAGRAVCFVWLFASAYRLCVHISDLFSLLCLLAPYGAGDGCVFVNLKDHQVFQGKDRKHGYSYQAAVFPNGHLVVNSLHSVRYSIALLAVITDS